MPGARGLQHGGIDKYVMKMKPELLGWEGMRIRILVRERLLAAGLLRQAEAAPAIIPETSTS